MVGLLQDILPSMYRGGYKDGIKTILEPIIDATDICQFTSLLLIY